MAEKEKQTYSLCCENNAITIKGVTKVIEISDKEAQLQLSNRTLVIRGDGINITRLDKEQGAVCLDFASLTSVSFKQSGGLGLKGLFR